MDNNIDFNIDYNIDFNIDREFDRNRLRAFFAYNRYLLNHIKYSKIKAGEIRYIKYNKYVITIQLLTSISFPSDSLLCLDFNVHFKVLDIENIVTKEHIKMKGRYIIRKNYNRCEKIFKIYDHAYFHNFIEKEQWKLFPNGFSGLCKIADNGCYENTFYTINGVKEGKYERYIYSDNNQKKLVCDGNYANGKRHGIFTIKGQLTTYINGEKARYYYKSNV